VNKFFLIAVLCFALNAFATPEKEILEVFNQRLDSLASPEAFSKFVTEHKNLFPNSKSQNPSMIVEKEELALKGDTFTLAIGYRQVFIKGKAEIQKDIWSAHNDYQKYYNLDGDSKVEGNFTKDKFKARIFKKVPAIEDQDYTLDYTMTTQGKYTFMRARLDKDAKGFALRDNLKVLEETKDGLIVREISYLYPLRWWVRAMGPTARKTMKEELNKVSVMEQCLVENTQSFPPTDATVKTCSDKSSKAE
jgi:hypothetical protein